MLVVKKDSMHAKGSANAIDIINAISYDTSMFSKHTEACNLGAIKHSTNNKGKSTIWAKELVT